MADLLMLLPPPQPTPARAPATHASIQCGATPEGGASGPPVTPASDLGTRRVTIRPYQLQTSSWPRRRSPSPGPAPTLPSPPAGGDGSSWPAARSPSPAPAPRALIAPPAREGGAGAGPAAGGAGGACSQCSGRGMVLASQGRAPCPACQPWSQRPDYEPAQPLLSLSDLDLGVLDARARGRAGGAGGAGASAGTSAGAGPAPDALSSGDEPGYASGAEGGGARKRGRGRLRGVGHGPMPESQRAAISAGLRRKIGSLSDEHKKRIAVAMRDHHAYKAQRQRCTYCGGVGHNRRACPLRSADASTSASSGEWSDGSIDLPSSGEEEWEAGAGAAGDARPRRRLAVCSECGQPGHNRRRCPQLRLKEAVPTAAGGAAAAAGADAAASAGPGAAGERGRPARRVIVVEVEDGLEAPGAGPEPAAADAAADASASVGGDDASGAQAAAALDSAQRQLQPPPPPPPLPPAAGGLATVPLTPAPLALTRGGPIALSPDGALVFPLPATTEQCVAQAAAAVLRAWEDGQRRQRVTLLLPQASAPACSARRAAPPDGGEGDWPGGIRQQFRAALPMVEALLLRLKAQRGLEGRVTGEVLDESDCEPRRPPLLLACEDARPTYERLLQLLRAAQGSGASRGWLQRIMAARGGGRAGGADYGGGAEGAEGADAPDGAPPAPGGAEGAAPPAAAAAAPPAAAPPAGETGAAGAAAAAAAGSGGDAFSRWRDDVDIVTNEPIPRDIRLDPLLSVARWLGAGGDQPPSKDNYAERQPGDF
eukprot:scaffold2.g7238.t1